jgi:hypothetical protein
MPPHTQPHEIYNFDPVLGWVNQPHSDLIFRWPQFSFCVRTNSHGMRYRDVSRERSPGTFRVAVLGDSFPWGLGVEDGDRFTDQAERALGPGVELLNFAVAGYGPLQSLLLLPKVLTFNPDAVVLTFCLSNDFGNNVFYRRWGRYKPFGRIDAAGRLEIAGYPLPNVKHLPGLQDCLGRPDQQGAPAGFDDLSIYVDRSSDPAELKRQADAIAYVAKVNSLILGEIKARLASVPLAIITAPTKCELGDCGAPSDAVHHPMRARDLLADAAREHGIPLIDTTALLEMNDYWPGDAHWLPSGHAKMAKALSVWVERNWLAQ